MENMVIQRLFEAMDELKPMIKRAYETASEGERFFLDQAIPVKLKDMEEWARGMSVETKLWGIRG